MLLNPCPCADRVNDVLAGNTVLSCSLLPYSPDAPLSSSQWWKASLGHHCSVPCPRSLELMNFPAQAQILSLQLSHLSQSLNLWGFSICKLKPVISSGKIKQPFFCFPQPIHFLRNFCHLNVRLPFKGFLIFASGHPFLLQLSSYAWVTPSIWFS